MFSTPATSAPRYAWEYCEENDLLLLKNGIKLSPVRPASFTFDSNVCKILFAEMVWQTGKTALLCSHTLSDAWVVGSKTDNERATLLHSNCQQSSSGHFPFTLFVLTIWPNKAGWYGANFEIYSAALTYKTAFTFNKTATCCRCKIIISGKFPP